MQNTKPTLIQQPISFEALRKIYLEKSNLNTNQIDSLIANASKIRRLGIEGFEWSVIDQAFSQFRDVSAMVHYEAIAKAMDFPFLGIEDFYKRNVATGRLPSWALNQTRFYSIPEKATKLPIGELVTKLGLVRQETVIKAIGIQRLIELETGSKPFLALILNHVGQLSAPDLYQSLAIQVGVEFKSLDQAGMVVDAIRNRVAA